ncbi:hypothetical protein [Escherichia coli]|uniref:hypothetical protein n=1 Tax=Escherichia coli TaxID=562 RepID=UPI0032B46389
MPGVTFFCISDTLVPTTYLVDTTLSNSSDSDQTVQAVRLRVMIGFGFLIQMRFTLSMVNRFYGA